MEELFVLSGGGGLYLGGPLKHKIVMFNKYQKCEVVQYFIVYIHEQAVKQTHSFPSYLLLTHL